MLGKTERLIQDAQREARDYLVKILSVLDKIPDDKVQEITPHLEAAYEASTRAVREAKRAKGLIPGEDSGPMPNVPTNGTGGSA